MNFDCEGFHLYEVPLNIYNTNAIYLSILYLVLQHKLLIIIQNTDNKQI